MKWVYRIATLLLVAVLATVLHSNALAFIGGAILGLIYSHNDHLDRSKNE